MRGKRANQTAEVGVFRITPAGAGKTEYYAFPDEETGDHPRRCGENIMRSLKSCAQTGSPPQVRGKRQEEYGRIPHEGITPAGAGKTPEVDARLFGEPDHPRRCGENQVFVHAGQPVQGSPPQVRGKPLDSSFTASRDGITPAGAGKTTPPTSCS